MLFNGILETTTGATTGDLTLSAVTDRPRFSDFFTANASEASADPFYYSILTQDAVPILVEQGIGWLSAAGTLKRATIIATYSSGVPTHYGSAFALTSGSTYNVICTPEAGALLPGLPDIGSLSGGTRALRSWHIPLPTAVGATVKDRMVYVPIRLDAPRRLVKIAANQGATAGVGGTNGWHIGLYTCLRNGLPGRRLQESGNINPSAYGEIGYTFSAVRYPPGWYYIGLCHDYATTTPTVYSNANAGQIGNCQTPLGLETSITTVMGCYEALSGGWSNLPATASGTLTRITSGGGVYAPNVAIYLE